MYVDLYGVELHDVDLHESFPNLAKFNIVLIQRTSSPIALPNMGECKELRYVHLGVPKCFVTQLPRGLKELCGWATIVNMDRTSLEQSFEDCNISTYIQFVTP